MNEKIFYFFYNFAHQNPFLDSCIVFVAKTFPYLVILAAGIFLLFHHDVLPSRTPWKIFIQKWKEIVLVFFSGIFAWCLANILKLLIHTPRPFLALPDIQTLFDKSGYSFPSGHATFFMALAFALFFSHKKIGYLFMFFALIIGLARIAAGVHFSIDILVGFILGIGTAYLVKFLYKKLI